MSDNVNEVVARLTSQQDDSASGANIDIGLIGSDKSTAPNILIKVMWQENQAKNVEPRSNSRNERKYSCKIIIINGKNETDKQGVELGDHSLTKTVRLPNAYSCDQFKAVYHPNLKQNLILVLKGENEKIINTFHTSVQSLIDQGGLDLVFFVENVGTFFVCSHFFIDYGYTINFKASIYDKKQNEVKGIQYYLFLKRQHTISENKIIPVYKSEMNISKEWEECVIPGIDVENLRNQSILPPLRGFSLEKGNLNIDADEVLSVPLNISLMEFRKNESDRLMGMSKEIYFVIKTKEQEAQKSLSENVIPPNSLPGGNSNKKTFSKAQSEKTMNPQPNDTSHNVKAEKKNLIYAFPLYLYDKKDLKDDKDNYTYSYVIENLHVVEKMTFDDYMEHGLYLNLITAIDFTLSNGSRFDPSSYHYLQDSETHPNQYEICLRAVGNVLCPYDYDGDCPTYIFGAKVDGTIEHCHELLLIDDQNAASVPSGIDEVIKAYRNALSHPEKYEFAGPTFFHEIIRQAIRTANTAIVPTDQEQNIAFKNPRKKIDKVPYTVLLILTDGVLNDMIPTVDAIVEASIDTPLSILIVGIGDADFSLMEELDADDTKLLSSKGKEQKRDNVQFIRFNDFKNKLASPNLGRELLGELPEQVLTYFDQHKNKIGNLKLRKKQKSVRILGVELGKEEKETIEGKIEEKIKKESPTKKGKKNKKENEEPSPKKEMKNEKKNEEPSHKKKKKKKIDKEPGCFFSKKKQSEEEMEIEELPSD